LKQISQIKKARNDGKNIFIAESGWPSQGKNNNKAIPSLENQKKAIDAIKEKVGNNCILFTAFNDFWKKDGPFSAEKYYGI
jgi:glucan 1,3-beta-glucosidase